MSLKQKNQKSLFRGVLTAWVLSALIFTIVSPAIFLPHQALAVAVPLPVTPVEVRVGDSGERALSAQEINEREKIYLKELAERQKEKEYHRAGRIAFKNALHYVFNTLAYDLATWIASGGEGEQPAFITEGWGPYLLDLGDAASAEFIGFISDWTGFDVCEPDFQLKINLGLALTRTQRPTPPAGCTLTRAISNWQEFLGDENFLDRFVFQFSPENNDILVSIKVFNQYFAYQEAQVRAGEKQREENRGYRPVAEFISDYILSPGDTVAGFIVDRLPKLEAESTFTDEIIADAIDTFVQTLAYKLFQRLLVEGLGSDGGRGLSGISSDAAALTNARDLYSFDSGKPFLIGREAAQARFADFLDAGIVSGGPYELLQKLASCVDITNPAPDECVIDEGFRLAVERELTVREAIDAGLIDGNGAFGFVAQDFQPRYNEGYPYRSLKILRINRILPVTWEIAAEVINRGFDQTVNGRSGVVSPTYTLNQLVAAYDDFDSPFYHLVDDTWVLKAHETFCAAEGYGPVLESDNIAGDDRNVDRGTYCADVQSCLEKDAEGNCIFGYCSEEKRIWDLGGETCPDIFNTCQSFQSREGDVAAYLQNTLAYNGCDASNVGCQWYCQEYNIVNEVWTCVNQTERVLKECASPGGCPLSASCNIDLNQSSCIDDLNGSSMTLSTICNPGSKFWDAVSQSCIVSAECTVAQGGVSCIQTGCEGLLNLLPNPGFEAGAFGNVASNWTWGSTDSEAYFERVGGQFEQVYFGDHSLRYFSQGGGRLETVLSDPLTLPAGSYSFSTFVFNRLNQGDVEVAIVDAITGVVLGDGTVNEIKRSFNQTYPQPNLYKNRWLELSTKDFSVTGSQPIRVRIQVSDPTQTSGSVWFDNLRISQSCILNPVQLALTGTVESDQSKIHFDRDVEACDDSADGCSNFLVAPEGIASQTVTVDLIAPYGQPGQTVTSHQVNLYNLIPNPSFEDGLDRWNINIIPSVQVQAELEHADTLFGTNALKLTKGSVADSGVSLVIDLKQELRGRAFIFSFWAKSSDPDPGPLNNGPENVDHFDENFIAALYGGPDTFVYRTSVNMSRAITGGGLSTTWKYFAVPIYFDQHLELGNTAIALALRPLEDESKYVLYDDLQLQEIDYRRARPNIIRDLNANECIGRGRVDNPYTIWVNSQAPTGDPSLESQQGTCYALDLAALLNRTSVNLRSAPDFLGCRGYTAQRPSPYILAGIDQAACEAGTNLVWREGEGCHEIDSPECFNYAPYCFADEVGCQAYSPIAGGQSIPGVVAFDDYCPAECVGYEAYKQSPTAFETQETLEFFVPSTADKCSAAQAGCDEFTNLDEVAAGGEGLYYFTYLRQCAVSSDPTANCSNFYAWEGSDETGFQLRVYNLSAENNGAPKLAIEDPANWPEFWGACDATTVGSNPFCREILDRSGSSHYVVLQNTVSCSNNCQPFRKTQIGSDLALAQQNCVNTNGRWDAGINSCIYNAIPNEGLSCSAAAAGCREYRGNAGANVFTAFSDNFEDGDAIGWAEGVISSEALSIAGHSLKSGNNFRVTTNNAKLSSGQCSLDNYSTCDPDNPDDFNCYDLGTARCKAKGTNDEICLVGFGQQYCGVIGDRLQAGKSYLVSFWAKADSQNFIPGAQLQLLSRNPGTDALEVTTIASTDIQSEWNYYVFGPFVDDRINGSTRFSIQDQTGNVAFYVDNIRIREVSDYVYVIKDSWNTPQSCDQNPYVDPITPAPQFMLGCQAYRTQNGQTANLKSFSSLCREEVIGCQALVDTQNSSSPYPAEFNVGDDIGYVDVPADSIIYMVNRSDFSCSAEFQGCQRFGLPDINQNNEVIGYDDVYLINDPDDYPDSLCASEEVGCEEFQTSVGFSYFKTPGDRFCEYRQIPGDNNFGWYVAGSVSDTPDCPVVRSPFGIVHPDPALDWVGLCPAEFSGCTEFVDPISDIATNVLFNSDFRQDVEGNGVPDGWNLANPGITNRVEQTLRLKPSTPYTLAIEGTSDLIEDGTATDLSIQVVCSGVSSFDDSLSGYCVGSDGIIGAGAAVCNSDPDCSVDQICALQLPPSDYQNDINIRTDFNLGGERQYSGRFFVPETHSQLDQCKSVVQLGVASSTQLRARAQQLIKQISIQETGTYYQIRDTVDRRSCSGIVDPQNGCVLFNDRSNINYKLGEADTSYLQFDADVSGSDSNNGLPVVECAGTCDSNVVLNVRPDRTCGQWLACQTKVKTFDQLGNESDFCIELAACDQFDETGNCTNFVLPDLQQINTYSDAALGDLFNLTVVQNNNERLGNISGYARGGTTLVGLGDILGQPFESQNTIDGYYPQSLMSQVGEVIRVPNGDFEEAGPDQYPLGWEPFDPNGPRETFRFKIVKPGAQARGTEGIEVLGNGSLKLNANNILVSAPITVFPNTDYALSASVNTINLQPDSAFANVDVIVCKDNACTSLLTQSAFNPDGQRIFQPARSLPEWQDQNLVFNTGDETKIKIKLFNSNPNPIETGNAAYYDNIQILPVLQVSDTLQTPANPIDDPLWQSNYISRSCRAFPESDSLSCRYFDDSGVERRGWSGYCLEPDPNNSDVCLQWWPVDLIKGDLFGQFPGYQDRVPQYYCARMAPTTFRVLVGDTGIQQGPPSQGGYTGVRTLVPDGEYGQPNFIEIVAVPAGGSSQFNVQNLRLNADINWEVGWIGEIADAENHAYTDYEGQSWSASCRDTAVCIIPYSDPTLHNCIHWYGGRYSYNGGIYSCQDTRIYGSTLDGAPYATPPTCGNDNLTEGGDPFLACSNTIIPDRVIEQVITGNGLGPNGEIMGGADRAKAAVSSGYCSNDTGFEGGLDDFKATFLYFKANFNDEGVFTSLDYGLCDLSSDPGNFQIYIYFHYAYCDELVQVVAPTGQNKAWLSRISEGSQYLVPTLSYPFEQDYQPFGSLVYPEPSYDPSQWDSKNDADDNPDISYDDILYIGNQPLFIEAADKLGFDAPYQVRAGSPYSCIEPDLTDINATQCLLPDYKSIVLDTEAEAAARLKRLFAESYGVWVWDDVTNFGTTGKLVRRVCADSTPFAGNECSVDRDCYPLGQTDVSVGACETLVSRYKKIDKDLLDPSDPNLSVAQALAWDPPEQLCLNNQRPNSFNEVVCQQAVPGAGCDYCAVAPLVQNIDINNKQSGQIVISNPFGSGQVDLAFNATVDSNQLPLSSYRIDWGDVVDSVSGTSLRDRSDVSSPYKFSHAYNYYDLLDRSPSDNRILCTGEEIQICNNFDIYCRTDADCPLDGSCGRTLEQNTCAIQPRIQLIDNWGWCNGNADQIYQTVTPAGRWGYSSNQADGCFSDNPDVWTYYPGYIIVGVND